MPFAGYKGVSTNEINDMLNRMFPGGRYRIESIDQNINGGSYSKVYAIRGMPGAVVKLGIFNRDYDKGGAFEEGVASYRNEIDILKRLQNNGHVVRYINSVEKRKHDGFYIFLIVEERYECVSKRMRQMGEKDVIRMALDILEALKEMRSLEIIHRDIKPDNIFYKNGRYYLGDFGACKDLKNNKGILNNGRFSRIGTPYFVAPEIIDPKSHNYGYKVDVFSLTRTMLDILSGGKLSDLDFLGQVDLSCSNRIKRVMRRGEHSIPLFRYDVNGLERALRKIG